MLGHLSFFSFRSSTSRLAVQLILLFISVNQLDKLGLLRLPSNDNILFIIVLNK